MFSYTHTHAQPYMHGCACYYVHACLCATGGEGDSDWAGEVPMGDHQHVARNAIRILTHGERDTVTPVEVFRFVKGLGAASPPSSSVCVGEAWSLVCCCRHRCCVAVCPPWWVSLMPLVSVWVFIPPPSFWRASSPLFLWWWLLSGVMSFFFCVCVCCNNLLLLRAALCRCSPSWF